MRSAEASTEDRKVSWKFKKGEVELWLVTFSFFFCIRCMCLLTIKDVSRYPINYGKQTQYHVEVNLIGSVSLFGLLCPHYPCAGLTAQAPHRKHPLHLTLESPRLDSDDRSWSKNPSKANLGHLSCLRLTTSESLQVVSLTLLDLGLTSQRTQYLNGFFFFWMGTGSNWIPADNFLTEISDERYRAWLDLLVKGNQNMVRVWGGGIFGMSTYSFFVIISQN